MHTSRPISFSTVLALSLCVLSSGVRGTAKAQIGGTRSRDWVQTSAADFYSGQLAWMAVADVEGGELKLSPGAIAGTYTSPVVQADFFFTAAAPQWRARVPGGTSLSVELRVYAEGAWSAWIPMEGSDPPRVDSRSFPESPLLTWNGERFQYRVTMGASLTSTTPVLEEMTITYIDATSGPSMSEATATQLGFDAQHGIGAQAVPQPAIIPRAGWGADESYRYDSYGGLIWPREYRTVEKIVVHHTVTTNDYTDGPYYVRAIYYYHAVTLGWGDIGYNYLVDKFGNIYQGRYGGPDVVAGHSYGHNYGSMGVSVIGTHTGVGATPASLASLTEVIAWEANRSYIHPLESSFFVDTIAPNIAGHHDYNTTTCPGDALYAELPAQRRAAWDRFVAEEDQYHVDWLAWDALPPAICARSTYSANITVRNTGWYTYIHAGLPNSVYIGYHWYDSQGGRIVQPPRVAHRGGLPYDLTFGHAYTYNPALVTTPITPGTYTLEWDMVQEGISWFHDANPASPVLTMTFVVTSNCIDFYSSGQSELESTDTVTVPIRLALVPGRVVTVPFNLSGTAARGVLLDYTATPSPVTIPAGITETQIAIALNDDSLYESDEAVVIELGTPAGYGLGPTAVHIVTVLNNDPPPAVGFSTRGQSALETAGAVTVTLELDAISGLTVTVPLTLSGTATAGETEDYTVTPSPPIPPGETSAEILIALVDDGQDEDDETVVLSLGAPTNATLGVTTVHTVTVLDPLALRGYVFDIHGRPVGDGQVAAHVGITATTDVSAAYALYLPPYGTYTVTASAAGYTPSLPASGFDGTQDNLTYSFALAPSLFVNAFENGQLEGDFGNLERGGISASPPAPTRAAHTGVGAAEMLVAAPGASTWLSQNVTMPSERVSPTLSLFYQVLSVGSLSRLQVTLAATSTVTYTLPLTVSGWTHFSVHLPPEVSGDVEVTFELLQSAATTPTRVTIDEISVGYYCEPYRVFLPLAVKNVQGHTPSLVGTVLAEQQTTEGGPSPATTQEQATGRGRTLAIALKVAAAIVIIIVLHKRAIRLWSLLSMTTVLTIRIKKPHHGHLLTGIPPTPNHRKAPS